jgi:nucleotide-binding universal stress UspA family protein
MTDSEPVTRSIPEGAVVVGVDGSETAARAVAWAARYAALEGRPLVLAHAFGVIGAPETVGLHFDTGAAYGLVYGQLQDAGEAVLAEVRAKVAETHPELEVATALDAGDPRTLLLLLAENAELVVMGSRGRGPFRSLFLGSVTATVAGRAGCPVVVVPPADVDR